MEETTIPYFYPINSRQLPTWNTGTLSRARNYKYHLPSWKGGERVGKAKNRMEDRRYQRSGHGFPSKQAIEAARMRR